MGGGEGGGSKLSLSPDRKEDDMVMNSVTEVEQAQRIALGSLESDFESPT